MNARTVKALSDSACKQAKPREKTYELKDAKVPGLRLRVMPSGIKSWSVRYRVSGGERRQTLAKYPAWGLAKARAEALKLQSKVYAGDDPSSERSKPLAKGRNMAALFGRKDDEGWFLGVHALTAGKIGTAKTPGTMSTDRSNVGHIRKQRKLMARQVKDVTVDDLNRLKTTLKDKPCAWRKCRNILRVAFTYAENEGWIPMGSSPVRRVTVTPERKIERYLTPQERKKLDRALAKAADIGPGKKGGLGLHVVLTFRLLLLTGMRVGEVLKLRWEWVDWRHGVIKFPTSKTGAKDTPLTAQAIALLRQLQGDMPRRGLVCRSRTGTSIGKSTLERAWWNLRKGAGLSDVRIHDLRHSWASDALSHGVSLAVVGRVLGHSNPTTTQRYAHLHDTALRRGLEVAGDAIEVATRDGRASYEEKKRAPKGSKIKNPPRRKRV